MAQTSVAYVCVVPLRAKTGYFAVTPQAGPAYQAVPA
jgi:hypothetical protein